MVMSMEIASYRDGPMRTGGLQARGAYKEVPRASLRLAPKSSWACTRVKAKRSLTIKLRKVKLSLAKTRIIGP